MRSKLLLISNKHVLEEGMGKMTLTLNRKKEDGTPDYGVLRTFTYDGFTDRYTSHPDENVDLACVDVSGITQSDACVKHLDEKFLTPLIMGGLLWEVTFCLWVIQMTTMTPQITSIGTEGNISIHAEYRLSRNRERCN